MSWIEALGPTALALVGGAIGWFLKDRIESSRAQEERLRQERVEAYSKILDPILAPFVHAGDLDSKELERMGSPDYRRSAFQFILVGSDDVVKSFNDFLQLLYKAESGTFDLVGGLRALGRVLLEVRKSIGSKTTGLTEKDMLRWLIKDIDSQWK